MKKASMQLGINAIVILIIALAVLGLAMSFITGLFRQSGAKYARIIDRTDLPFHADIVTPVMFETKEVTVKTGRQEPLVISVYNDKFKPTDEISLELAKCIDSNGQEAWNSRNTPTVWDRNLGTIPDPNYQCIDLQNDYEPTLSIRTSPQMIPIGMDAGYMALVSASVNATTGSYICTVRAGKWETQTYTPPAVDIISSCVDPVQTTLTQQLVINVER